MAAAATTACQCCHLGIHAWMQAVVLLFVNNRKVGMGRKKDLLNRRINGMKIKMRMKIKIKSKGGLGGFSEVDVAEF